MLSVFQIITDRRSSRLMVVPLAEKEMKASGAEWTEGTCEEIGKHGEVVSFEVVCSRTLLNNITCGLGSYNETQSHFYQLHHLSWAFSYYFCLQKVLPCLLLCYSPMLPFPFNKSYFFPCLFLSCALCFNFLIPLYISFPWGHKLKLTYLELEAL